MKQFEDIAIFRSLSVLVRLCHFSHGYSEIFLQMGIQKEIYTVTIIDRSHNY